MSTSTANSRSRKKNDDAPYFSSMAGTSGTKRVASSVIEGDRAKRKRVVEPTAIRDGESRSSLVEFEKLPMAAIYRYLTQFDLIPSIYPSPLSANDPPPPYILADPVRPPPSPPPVGATPANRPQRNLSKEHSSASRTRSSKVLEDEISRVPILADVDELHAVLAGIAEKHFREMTSISGREEVDTLASFMCAVEKTKGAKWK